MDTLRFIFGLMAYLLLGCLLGLLACYHFLLLPPVEPTWMALVWFGAMVLCSWRIATGSSAYFIAHDAKRRSTP